MDSFVARFFTKSNAESHKVSFALFGTKYLNSKHSTAASILLLPSFPCSSEKEARMLSQTQHVNWNKNTTLSYFETIKIFFISFGATFLWVWKEISNGTCNCKYFSQNYYTAYTVEHFPFTWAPSMLWKETILCKSLLKTWVTFLFLVVFLCNFSLMWHWILFGTFDNFTFLFIRTYYDMIENSFTYPALCVQNINPALHYL